MTEETTTYRRAELYEEVWKEPVRTVAQRYGVSDVALRRICLRLRVPLPGRGHWRAFWRDGSSQGFSGHPACAACAPCTRSSVLPASRCTRPPADAGGRGAPGRSHIWPQTTMPASSSAASDYRITVMRAVSDRPDCVSRTT